MEPYRSNISFIAALRNSSVLPLVLHTGYPYWIILDSHSHYNMALQISLDLPFVLRNHTGLTLVSIRHYDIYRSYLLRYGIIPDLHSYYNIAPRISLVLPFVLRNHTGLTLTLTWHFEFFGLAFCATESYRAHILIIIWHYRFLRTCPFVLRNHTGLTLTLIWHFESFGLPERQLIFKIYCY